MQIDACSPFTPAPAGTEGRTIRVHYLRREGAAKVMLLLDQADILNSGAT